MNIKYFTCANSCMGLVNLTDKNLAGIDKIYSIKSGYVGCVSEIAKSVGKHFEGKNFAVEYILNPFDEVVFDGIIIRNFKTLIINDNIISDGEKIEISSINFCQKEASKADRCCKAAYDSFRKAKKIHDKWERVYIDKMDFNRLDAFKKRTIDKMFDKSYEEKDAQTCERFFGGITKSGYVNLIGDLTQDISLRYLIKGRPGTGKSTFMKEVAQAASERGFDAEVYRCSFDTDSVDMVIVRDANFCVFDSTHPHEIFPEREGDCILDFYKESGLCGIDEKYRARLKKISEQYRKKIRKGSKKLRCAAAIWEKAEKSFNSDKIVAEVSGQIIKEIEEANDGVDLL